MIAGALGLAAPAQAATPAAPSASAAAAFPAKPCKYVVGKPYRKGHTIMVKVWAGKCAKFPPDAIATLWRSRWYGYQSLKPYATCKRKAGNCVVTVKYHCPHDTTYTYKASATLTSGSQARQWGPTRRIHCPAFIST